MSDDGLARWSASSPVAVVIPALDEEASVGDVVRSLPRALVREVVVVDNGSRDGTARAARQAGARVVVEPQRGYGRACLAGLEALGGDPPAIVVFLDADASDDPRDLPLLLEPILAGRADLVVGARRGEPGSLTALQRAGNRLATFLIRLTSGHRFTDLGPFRALRWSAVRRLDMTDEGYGWTVEMQVKAVRRGLRCVEVPVRYRPRVGRSKISGTVRGALGAGAKILLTVFREALRPVPRTSRP